MNGYQENVLKKIDGRWALVSRRTHRPLAYYRGSGKPSPTWVEKQERRVQFFKHRGGALMPSGEPIITDCFPNPPEEEHGGAPLFWVLSGLALAIGGGYLIYSLSKNPPVTVIPPVKGPPPGKFVVGGSAVESSTPWHAWKQTFEGADEAVIIYNGNDESVAKTYADYWANQGWRTGYYQE